MKERKITLQETRALTDVSYGLLIPYLNGKSIGVLHWINTGIKFRKSSHPVFPIDWSYIASIMNMKTTNVTREVNNLIKKGILIKAEPGSYTWDLEGMERLINPKTKEVVQVIKIEPEKIIIMPENVKTNDYGLATDEFGNIIF